MEQPRVLHRQAHLKQDLQRRLMDMTLSITLRPQLITYALIDEKEIASFEETIAARTRNQA